MITFEDTATKFFEHFVLIAEALNEQGMWNEEDKFFYDTLSIGGIPGAAADPVDRGADDPFCRFHHRKEHAA